MRAGSRQAAEAVAGLLDALNRHRDHLTPASQNRLVTRLTAKAEEAGSWLTDVQRHQVTAWQHTPPPTPRPVTLPPRPPAPSSRGKKARSRRKPDPVKTAPFARPTDVETVAAAARDVLEHAARLGKTVAFSQLCAQVKGLVVAGRERAARSPGTDLMSGRSVLLAALITMGDSVPHPHIWRLAKQAGRQLPEDEAATRAAGQQVVADVHERFQRP